MKALSVKTEAAATYSIEKSPWEDDLIVEKALAYLKDKLYREPIYMTSSSYVKNYCALLLAEEKIERFYCFFLDYQHKLIASEILFSGSIASCSVYPRELLRKILDYNAAAIIIAHNHPSGATEPSEPDKNITRRIKELCTLIEVDLLDHIIVGAAQTYSFSDDRLL